MPNKFNDATTWVNGYLLNRAHELEKEGLESKYELIKLILANFSVNNNLCHLIGERNLQLLEQYVRNGPFYSGSDLKVLTD